MVPDSLKKFNFLGEKMNAFNKAYWSLELADRQLIAHQPSDMFKRCAFGTLGLESDDCRRLISAESRPIFSDTYGVCYVFNFGANGSAVSFNPGGQYGLRLVINIESK